MGQYWLPVNVDKREFLDPHKFGDGLKFMEFGASPSGTMNALAVLLAQPESMGHGGGDLRTKNPIVGHWIGDLVVLAGDYGLPWPGAGVDPERPEKGDRTLYKLARQEFTDITADVLAALFDDPWFREEFLKQVLPHQRHLIDEDPKLKRLVRLAKRGWEQYGPKEWIPEEE